MKALKATISGSYKTSQGEVVDFEEVTGAIPFVDDEHAFMHIQSRYAADWIRGSVNDKGEKLYPDRIEKVRQVFLDETEETSEDFTYVGKDIKKMTYNELQDLATAKDLRYIPLPKFESGFSLREARIRAYIAYSEKIMHNFINENDSNFNFAELPAIVVDGDIRREVSVKVTNDEILEQEMKPMMGGETPKDNLTLEELKEIADKKGIKYHWKIGHDKLYNMLYGGV